MIDEEFRYHLERQIHEGLTQGLSAEEARHAAMRALGAITQNQEECRTVRGVNRIEETFEDLRYGFRILRRDPAFTVIAILALALGIGANTVMFSVAWGMLVRPLPYAHADRVAVVYMNYASRNFRFGTLCIRDYLIWKQSNRVFENPSLFSMRLMDIGGREGAPEQVQGATVTAGFFDVLGIQPLIGRTFAVHEDDPGTRSLAVINESIWKSRFGGRPDVLGETILVNGAPSTVIGVIPQDCRFPRRETEVWTNLPLNPPTRYGPWFYRGIARLKPGVTLPQAQAELNDIALRMMQQNSDYKRLKLPVLSLREAILGISVRPAILVLSGAVGLVLLIAVVNVAGLMLARATVRTPEMAMRLTLGAAAVRLVRQLLTESVLLAMAGGGAGLALAWAGIKAIRVWNPGDLPLIDSVRLDWGALAFMILVSAATGILFGLAPALRAARADLNSGLKQTGRATTAGGARTRSALVITEIAISLVLLVGAGLLLRSFVNLQQVDGGFFAPRNSILTMVISPGSAKYNDPRVGTAFYNEVLRAVRSVHGVTEAAVTDSLPPDRQGDADTFGIEGQTLAPGEINPVTSTVTVGPDLFSTLGVPLIAGRIFSEHDNADSKPVAIVSEGFARHFFPNQNVLGKRIRHSSAMFGEPWMEIVGVVGNVKYLGLTADTDDAYYMPFAQQYQPRIYLAVRSSGDAAALVQALRRNIQSIDPGVTLADIGTMEEALDLSVSEPRFATLLLGLFAGIALLLAAVGIYGLISYSVARRTREIGMRVALGARQADILQLIVGQGLVLAAAGTGFGLAGAFAFTRLLKTMVFGIGVTDALTFAAAPLGMVAVALLAALVPAVRAMRISPVVALRNE